MSSLAPPPGPVPGGPAPSGPAGAPPVGPQDSILNPNDALRGAARGRLSPDMTVRQGLEQMGIDVDGPISQLPGAMKSQVQNATTEGKIRSAAPPGASAPGLPGGPAPLPGGPAPSGGGLGSLLGR